MLVLLCEDVDNLGEMGQTVKVAPGYARNYLFPRKLAVPADSASGRQLEHEMAILRRKEAKRRSEMESLAKRLEKVTLDFAMRVGEHDRLYGSVTTVMLEEKLRELNLPISRKCLELTEPIKAVGSYLVSVKLPGGVRTQIRVNVVPLVEETPATTDATAQTGAESESTESADTE